MKRTKAVEEFYSLLNSISDDLNFAINNPKLVNSSRFYEHEKSGLPKLDMVQFKFLPVNLIYYLLVKFKFTWLYPLLWKKRFSVLEQFYDLYRLTSSESTVVCYAGELGLMKNKFKIKQMLRDFETKAII